MIESASTTFLTISSRSRSRLRPRAGRRRRGCAPAASAGRARRRAASRAALLVGRCAWSPSSAARRRAARSRAHRGPGLRHLAAGDAVDLPDQPRHRRGHPAAHQRRDDEDDDEREAAEGEQLAPPVAARLQAADDAGPAADAAAALDAQPGDRRIERVVEPDLAHHDAALGQLAGHRLHAGSPLRSTAPGGGSPPSISTAISTRRVAAEGAASGRGPPRPRAAPARPRSRGPGRRRSSGRTTSRRR